MRTRPLLLLAPVIAAGLASSACKPKPAPVAVPDAAAPAEAPPPAPMAEAEVRALLERWLGAQNKGDFAAYKALYAGRFFGVRRSGPRTVQLDHDGWLADRERMFKKPMTVEAKDVTIRAAVDSAVVRFTQSWSSGDFHDVGPKEMVVAKDADAAGALRISREELLQSQKVKRDPGELLWVLDGEAVLARDLPESAPWLTGKPDDESGDEGNRATRQVKQEALPQPWRGQIGQKRLLLTASGHTCEATLSPPRARSWMRPHFGEMQRWQGSEDGDKAWSPAQIAAVVWPMGQRLLLSPVHAEACDDAVLALPAGAKAPALSAGEEAAPALVKAAWAVVRKLPAYAKIQKEYAAATLTGKRAARWEDYGGPVVTEATLYKHEKATLLHFTFSAGSEPEPCGGESDFYGTMSLLLRVEGKRITLVSDDESAVPRPEGVVDLDGDGQVEVLLERALLGLRDGHLEEILSRPEMPDYDCPC